MSMAKYADTKRQPSLVCDGRFEKVCWCAREIPVQTDIFTRIYMSLYKDNTFRLKAVTQRNAQQRRSRSENDTRHNNIHVFRKSTITSEHQKKDKFTDNTTLPTTSNNQLSQTLNHFVQQVHLHEDEQLRSGGDL